MKSEKHEKRWRMRSACRSSLKWAHCVEWVFFRSVNVCASSKARIISGPSPLVCPDVFFCRDLGRGSIGESCCSPLRSVTRSSQARAGENSYTSPFAVDEVQTGVDCVSSCFDYGQQVSLPDHSKVELVKTPVQPQIS